MPQVEALREVQNAAIQVRSVEMIARACLLSYTTVQTGEPCGFQRALDALNVLGRTKWCACSGAPA